MDCIFGSRGQGNYRGAIMLMITYFGICKTFLARKSFCEMVMKSKNKESLGPITSDLTDDEFVELQHLAHLKLLKDDFLVELDNDRSI